MPGIQKQTADSRMQNETKHTIPYETENTYKTPLNIENNTTIPLDHIEVVPASPQINNVEHEEHPDWIAVNTIVDSGAARSVCPLPFCNDFKQRNQQRAEGAMHSELPRAYTYSTRETAESSDTLTLELP